jgi:hypothetical protein
LHGVTAIGVHAIAGLLGNEGGCHHPAVVACFGEIPVEPVPTGPRFIDKEQLCGLRWQLADEVINVTVAGADGPEVDDLSVVIFGDVSHGNRVFVDVHSDGQRARLAHG